MAEIDFKRRGTPLWAVLLVLVVIGTALYALFTGRGDQPVTAAADSTETTTPATPAAPAPGQAPTPAAPSGPLAQLSAWVDSAPAPTGVEQTTAYASRGLTLLADAMQEKAPMAGAQQVLVRAMADTVGQAASTPRKRLDATQAAFFAVVYAMRQTPGGARLENAAQRLELTRPLAEQGQDLKKFFQTARDVFTDPSKGLPGAPAPAGAPKA